MKPMERLKKPLAVLAAMGAIGGLAAGAASAAPEAGSGKGITIVKIDQLELGKNRNNKIGIWKQVGYKVTSQVYQAPNIKRSITEVLKIPKLMPHPLMETVDIQGGQVTGGVNLPLDVKISSVRDHGVVLVKDVKSVSIATTGKNNEHSPAKTTQTKKARVSYLAPIEGVISAKYFDQLNLDDSALQTEICNNMLDVTLNPVSANLVDNSRLSPADKKKMSGKMPYETFCNSYGVAVASRHGKLSYTDYYNMTHPVELGDTVYGTIHFPYMVFSRQIYNQLG